jgi:HPt (histidine-containing phosphotransfer) domain-containing protein
MGLEPPSAPILDESVLSRLEEMLGGPEPVAQLVALFLQEAPLVVDRLATALAEQRVEDAHAAAHSLKSSAATVGLRRLGATCAAIEELARTGRLSSVAHAEERIRGEFRDGQELLRGAIA